MARVLVCGGRDFVDEWMLEEVLNDLNSNQLGLSGGISTLIHGGARGADKLAGRWAAYNGVETFSYPADWDRDGQAAGPIRNRKMLYEGRPSVVVAFPGGRGTADMVGQARKAGVDVIVVKGDAEHWWYE